VEQSGPLDSRELWRWLSRSLPENGTALPQASTVCRPSFTTVAGGSVEGWSLLHTWDLVERQTPAELFAHSPSGPDARAGILRQTVTNCYAVPELNRQIPAGNEGFDFDPTGKNEGCVSEVLMHQIAAAFGSSLFIGRMGAEQTEYLAKFKVPNAACFRRNMYLKERKRWKRKFIQADMYRLLKRK
jgi:hypothetical protein